MIIEISAKHLSKAGWYEGRESDITDNVKFLEIIKKNNRYAKT